MMKIIALAVFVTALCVLVSVELSQAQSATPFKVVVNQSNPTTSIPKERLSQLFLRKTKAWQDGTPVEPVDLKLSSVMRGKFCVAVHDKSVAAVKAYWQQQIFSGQGTPPPELESDTEVIAYVKSHVGAIGYVSLDANVQGVTVVEVSW
jgi:ABC-type phosphate transport system substrate-binding protein